MSYLKQYQKYQDDRPSRSKIAYRRLRRLLRPFLVIFITFGFLGTAGWFIFEVTSGQQFKSIQEKIANLSPLRITKIEISGCNLTSFIDVKKALGVSEGDSILKFSVKEAKRNIETLPFVDHVLLERQLPGTIIVQISERAPFAVWQHQGKFLLIDRKGVIVKDQGMVGKDAQAFLKLPLVVGKGANTAAAELIDILSKQPEIKNRVVAIVRVGERRWNLDLRDGTTILLPESQEIPAIQRLLKLQQTIQLLDRPVQDIDLRLPDRLVIRPNTNTSLDNTSGNPENNQLEDSHSSSADDSSESSNSETR